MNTEVTLNRFASLLSGAAGAALALLALPSFASAQSLWASNGPTATMGRFNGGPAGPCAFPAGPVLGVVPYAPVFFACPTAGPVPGPVIGDIALARATDTLWVTDGVMITNLTRAGAVISSKPAPILAGPPITGLGYGAMAAGPVLWVTDGIMAAAVAIPGAPCMPFVFVVPPFPLPMPAAGAATDIDYDPMSGTLFVSTVAGLVVNVVIGGPLGPFGVFPAPCLAPLQVGIAVDTSTCGTLFVTDGVMVAHIMFGGAPAAPTIYAPAPCFPFPGPPAGTNGLTFDAAGVPFGASCDPMLVPPVMTTAGQATTAGPGFSVTMTGAAPGITLLIAGGPACPPGFLGVCPVYAIPAIVTLGPFPCGPAPLTIPLPIPAGVPCTTGAIGLQFLVAKGGGGFQTTNGIEISIAQP